MKMLIILIALIVSLFGFTVLTYAKDDHSGHEENHEDTHTGHKEDHDDHGDHSEHEDNHNEETSTTVGPEKGIIEKAEAGFKLSPEAIQTMQIKSAPFAGGSFTLPSSALVQIKDEKTVFRIRNDWFKRVSIQITKKSEGQISITSKNFRAGDQIVIDGAGFLRISEIFSEEGAAHGHSH